MNQRLNIGVIFPDDSESWDGAEERVRVLLAPHAVTSAKGVTDPKAEAVVTDAEILLAFYLSEALLLSAKKIRWIQGMGAGVDRLLALPGLPDDLILTNARGIHGCVAEAAIAMMFALARDVPRSVRAQQAQRWEPFDSVPLEGKRLGILGSGSIARSLAAKARGLGMGVEAISRTPRIDPAFDRIHDRSRLIEAASTFDIFVLLAPLDAGTRGIVDERLLGRMKPSAYLINVARGALIDETALIHALRTGQIAGAALDTFVQEPLPADSPLWSLPNTIITPHNAGRNARYLDDVTAILRFNIDRYLVGDIAGMRNLVTR